MNNPINLSLALAEYEYTFVDDGDNGSIPIITLEVISDSFNPDPILANYVNEPASNDHFDDALSKDAGVHFLTEQINEDLAPKREENREEEKDVPKVRHDMLEYMLRTDGRVICKTCGEVLQSRTHWYRHKYKRHVPQPHTRNPLFQCEQCPIYFKSKKGYIGHIASTHSEILSNSSPVSTNTQTEAFSSDNPPSAPVAPKVVSLLKPKEEHDPELVIPKSSVPNYQTTIIKPVTKTTETRKTYRGKEQIVNQADWEEKRSREDKLVADIIDRVRRECEAQPTPGPARRSYARRTPVIHTLQQTNALQQT